MEEGNNMQRDLVDVIIGLIGGDVLMVVLFILMLGVMSMLFFGEEIINKIESKIMW